jgi:hypothetical protein
LVRIFGYLVWRRAFFESVSISFLVAISVQTLRNFSRDDSSESVLDTWKESHHSATPNFSGPEMLNKLPVPLQYRQAFVLDRISTRPTIRGDPSKSSCLRARTSHHDLKNPQGPTIPKSPRRTARKVSRTPTTLRNNPQRNRPPHKPRHLKLRTPHCLKPAAEELRTPSAYTNASVIERSAPACCGEPASRGGAIVPQISGPKRSPVPTHTFTNIINVETAL